MSFQQEYIERFCVAMREKGRSETDIEKCCRYASTLLGQGLPVLFDSQHTWEVLRLYELNLRAYHKFSIAQVGKLRIITAPSIALKQRQTWILRNILNKIDVPKCVHGFEIGHSIKTNALVHAHNNYVLCVDIKDFFPSIKQHTVFNTFRSFGYSASAASSLSSVCCYDGALPQGAPTSPRLANIIFKVMDNRLSALADAEKAVYTRYADDLTFSSDHPLDKLLPQIKLLLAESGFVLNEEKIQFFAPNQPKRITGLIVQQGAVRVPKIFKRTLRQEIHYCRKYGVLTHLENIKAAHFINYREHLYGKAYYIHMIEPDVGLAFLEELDQIEWP